MFVLTQTLAQVDKNKSTFLNNLSHELRMPLTLISGPLNEMVSDTTVPLQAVHRGRADMIKRNSSRLLRLVNSLLDYSRIEAGRMTGTFVPVNMAQVMLGHASVFRSVVENAGLTFTIDVDGDLGDIPVFIDKDMWEKVVFNLLSNAFKFTLSGGITVALHGGKMPASLQSINAVVMSVSDTGCGVPEGEIKRLFERFHRVETTRGRGFEGTGIGLSLTRELVQLHGGFIDVQSTLGKGTTFSVYLPVGSAHLPTESVLLNVGKGDEAAARVGGASSGYNARDAFLEEAARWYTRSDSSSLLSMGAAEAASVAQPNTAATPAAKAVDRNVIQRLEGDIIIEWLDQTPVLRRADLTEDASDLFNPVFKQQQHPHPDGKPLVLVVDDMADMREFMEKSFQNRYRVVTAVDGQDALDKLHGMIETIADEAAMGIPDVIVTDEMMPRIDGIELIQRIHADPIIKGIPIILLSARAGEEARVEGLQAGSDEYMSKPFAIKVRFYF